MTIIKSEFFLALNQVATEREISINDVLNSIQEAVLAAYKKDFKSDSDEEDTELSAVIDKDTGETHVFKGKEDITPSGFGRIAAQTARQVILQKIREAEKREIVKHYTNQVGTIIRGRVIRFDPKYIHFDIGKAEGVLPGNEKIRGEDYSLNKSYMVYIKKIEEDDFGNSRIVLSRSDPLLVGELFKKEVPEIANNTVKINGIVREAGDRVKIAVYSEQQGVDPVGACVGQKGIRVKAVNDELGIEEKIDIIQFNKDPELYIREALSPAKVESIEINTEKKSAKVFVTQEQAPLAIGRNGTNVYLASQLTGFNQIDIVQLDEKKSQKSEKESKEKDTEISENTSQHDDEVDEHSKDVV